MKLINTNKKIIVISIFTGFIITLILAYITKSYAATTSENLAEKFIRFHVIANSDSDEDQRLKIAVRDKVLENLSPELNSSESIQQTRRILENNKENIISISKTVIKDWGKDYDVKVSLGQSSFPTKRYGDIVLPPGSYEALKIEIGEAKGKNWWCVMFPPLCFVDVTQGIVPEEAKEDLKNILTEDEFEMVLALNKESDVPLKLKFKVVEWWQERYNNTEQIFANSK